MFGLSGKCQVDCQRTHADEKFTLLFFTRDVRIVFHRGKDTGVRKGVYGELGKSVYFRQLAIVKKPCGSHIPGDILTGMLV